MMDGDSELIALIERCLVPKLERNFEEYEKPEALDFRDENFNSYFQQLINAIENEKFAENFELSPNIVVTLIILHEDLKCFCPWNNEDSLKNAQKLNNSFSNALGLSLNDFLINNNKFTNSQQVLDLLLHYLHQKATNEAFKRYPSLLEVYHNIIKDIKNYNVVINPMTVLPISLLLVEDYVNSNKIKGLKCCSYIFNCLTTDHFLNGNYYEVIYGSLKKNIPEKDIDVTKLLFECLLQYIKLLPGDAQHETIDNILVDALDQLYSESNLYRKALYFGFLKHITDIHKINMANKMILKLVFCDNVELCCNSAVAEILMKDVLECLEVWIKYCWCIWQLSANHKLLSSLFKLLFTCKEEQSVVRIQRIIVTLICLSSKEEQRSILGSLTNPNMSCPDYKQKLELIKSHITT